MQDGCMNEKLLAGTLVLIALLLSACTSVEVKRATYESAYQKECIERTGRQNCDPEHKPYDEYIKERDRAVQ